MHVSDFTFIAPELALFASAIVVLLLDCWLPAGLKRLNYMLSQFGLLFAILLALPIVKLGYSVEAFSRHLVIDPLSALLKVAIYLTVFGVFLYGRTYIQSRGAEKGEHYVLALMSTVGMSFLVSSNSLVMLYIGLELFSLPLYALIAMQQSQTYASEASMKYFVMGGIASGMLLYGMSLLFGLSNSIILSDIAAVFPAGTMIGSLATVMIVAAIAFKLGAVPFHMWVPDVYEGAPTDIAAFIASAAKIAAFGLTFRLLVGAIPQLSMEWEVVLLALATASLVLGNIIAIAQTNIKRMLAYSTVSHVSFILLGFVASTSLAEQGLSSALFYAIVYAFTTLGVFGVLLLLSRSGFDCEEIDDLKGLSRQHPWYALILMILVFSLAGVPPTIGFYAKLLIVNALIQSGVWLGAVAAMLMSVVGAFYYLRVIRVMYFDAPEQTELTPIKAGLAAKTLLSVNALMALVLGLAPMGLYSLCLSVL